MQQHFFLAIDAFDKLCSSLGKVSRNVIEFELSSYVLPDLATNLKNILQLLKVKPRIAPL